MNIFFTTHSIFTVFINLYFFFSILDSTKVWALNVLQDYTVISGDSLGHVQLWDGRHGTLLKSFSQHTADVTCLAISSDEKSIYASGFDHKIILLKRVQDCSKSRNGALIDPWEEDVEDDSMAIERDEEEDIEPTDGEWVYVCNQRPHTHDGKYSKRRRSNVAVLIVGIVFMSSFLFYCLLFNHSFPTNPNRMTNCF